MVGVILIMYHKQKKKLTITLTNQANTREKREKIRKKSTRENKLMNKSIKSQEHII